MMHDIAIFRNEETGNSNSSIAFYLEGVTVTYLLKTTHNVCGNVS